MARTEAVRYSFNRGLISPRALARVDIARAALSAEIQTNWMPRSLGSMMLRAGLQYIGATAGNAASRMIEFVRSLTATHLLEFTTGALRIWTNDALLTRVSVSAAISNGTFDSNLTGWTDADEGSAASVWVTGGYMGLTGTGSNRAIRYQQVTVAAIDRYLEHALRIVVQRGPVQLRVGSTVGGDDYISQVTLGTGTHSLAFTPSTDFYVQFQSPLLRQVLIDSVAVESAGTVSLTSPYLTADLGNIRANVDSLSVDVLFVGCAGYQQRRIERRNSGRSWSIILYQPEDGPFRSENTTSTTITPGALNGNTTLTASVATFVSTHVGALFRIASTGQTVTKNMTALNDATGSIRITGIGTDRTFSLVLTGLTATGNTVILQRSFDGTSWASVAGYSYTADASGSVNDALDNQIVYYRLICTVYASGTTVGTLSNPNGSIAGVCRVTAFTSSLVVDVEVLSDFGATTGNTFWSEGQWSDYRGWPSSGALYEGRLCWGGYDKITLSESDAFDAFSPDTTGDSASINRSIGSGPMDQINWILPLQRLILGAQLAEHSVRSNTFDEPITPTNFNRKTASRKGGAAVQAISLGSHGMYVGRSGTRLYELGFDPETGDYHSVDMTILNPEVLEPYVVRMAVQFMPDVRVHCILSDGTAAVLVYDSAEKVQCWVKLETTGTIEDVCVLPAGSGVTEDRVYYTVARTVSAATVRYVEKFALESECQGGTLNKQADAFVVATGGSATLTGLSHLEGLSVVVWANGKSLGTYTVTGGSITVSEVVDSSGAIVGLTYTARFQTAKLGKTLAKQKSVDHVAPILYNTHASGLYMGADFDVMDNLPLMYHGTAVDPDTVYAEYDEQDQEFPGTWDTDARVCLKAIAPKPCTVLALVIDGQVST